MQQQQVITVEPRASHGKTGARKVRKAGKIPGVLYGHNEKPQSFAIDPHALQKSIASSGAGRNTVLEVSGLERKVLALLKDLQFDPVKHRLIHIDLVEIRETDEVIVEVPVVLEGKPVGVVDGGILQAVRRGLRIYCRPLAIPREIKVDTTPLKIGDSIHIRDVKFPEGTRTADGGHLTVATVVAPAAEEKAEDTAAAAAAAAAPGAEGAAAPAAGQAAEEAAAPAKKEKK